MKICILNSRHPVSDTRVKRIAETLSEAGHEVTVAGPVYGDEGIDPFDERLNITFIGINHQAAGDFEKKRSLAGIIKTILSRINVSFELLKVGLKTKNEVYHCNEMDSWVVGILLKYLLGSKVIFDVHEYYPARTAEVISNRTLSLLMERVSRFLFYFLSLFSDGFIFINQSLPDLYKFHGVHVIVRNCVRKRDFSSMPVNEDLQRIFQDRVIVSHIGSMREGYGVKAMLDSQEFITAPEVMFLVLGGAADGFLQEAENRGFAERIKVIEQMPFEDMLEYLSITDIGITLLQPKDKNMIYSLGRKSLEYIAAGIPVIVPDFPEYRSLVEQYDLGLLVDPEDPRDIANAVTRLAEDQRLRAKLGENAARAFEVELNWEMESRKLFELYNELKVEG